MIQPVLPVLQGSGEIAGELCNVSAGNGQRVITGRSRHSGCDSRADITMAAETSRITLDVLLWA
jgi:hypothetical protein